MRFKKRDWILLLVILIILLIGLLIYFQNRRLGKSIRVLKNNEVIEEISLGKDLIKEFQFDDQTNTLVIKNGEADVTSANCANQICVNTHPISEVGETIACLPHSLIFEVIEN